MLSSNNNQPGNINVVCRFRPLNEKEKMNSKDICVDIVDEQQVVMKSNAENNNYKFCFDRIFELSCTQQDIFEGAAQPIIESVLEGFNGTIFAYGQTASGKTHTMQGDIDSPENAGITPRMIRHVFNHFATSSSDTEYTVKVSMLEIYMEKINDLIDSSRTNLHIREDKVKGIYVEDLTEHYVSSEEEVYEFIKLGTSNRAVGKTNMNEHSSRSHLIFLMTIHQTNVKTLVSKTGKLCLVDLAGSEKISKTGATGLTLEEAKTINRSLTTLGMVINNLTDGKSQHVPYRESKLTRILQESLGGNSKTRLIITCSPSTYNEQETLSTLRFGLRAKKIKNKPKVNKEVTVAELKIEIEKLEKLLLLCNDRVQQLEGYIRFNNLPLPAEGDFTFMKHSKKNLSEENKENNEEINQEVPADDIESDYNIIKEEREFNENLDFVDNNENPDADANEIIAESNNPEDELNLHQNEKKLKEITEKYSNVIQQYHILHSDKNILSEKYEEAVNKIQEFSVTVEQKEKLVDELNEMKRKHIELYETIYELQNKISELQKKKEYDISVSVDLSQNGEIQERSEIENLGDTDMNTSSNLIDLVNDNHTKNLLDEKINLKEETTLNTFNSSIPDDVYNKLQNIFNLDKNYLNEKDFESQIKNLSNLIRNKFNLESLFDKIAGNNFEIIQESSLTFEVQSKINVSNSSELLSGSNQSKKILFNEDDFTRLKNKFKEEKKAIMKTLDGKSEKVNYM
jgi:kinesin family protein 5